MRLLLLAWVLSADPSKEEVTVVVATRDLMAGETVTFDDIAQEKIGKRFVSASVVKPDSASYIVNQKLNYPVLKGDLMYWSFFETAKATQKNQRCLALAAKGANAAAQVAQARQVAMLHVK